MKRFKIDYSFILFLLLVFFSPKQFLLWKLLLTLLMHECGHLMMIIFTRYEIDQLKLSIFGFSLKLKHSKPIFIKDLLVYSGGILVNACCYFLCRDTEFRYLHLMLLILNSLPIYPLDGFNIFKTLCFYIFPHFYALWLSSIASFGLCIALFIGLIYLQQDLFLIWSFLYLVIEGGLLIYHIPKLNRLFLLQKELYPYDYPIKKISFKEFYWRYFYTYHTIEMVVGNKKIAEKDLLKLKNKTK